MLETEPTQRVRIPGFIYRGFKFPQAEVATDIEDLNHYEPVHELHKCSTTLAEVRALYEVALAIQQEEDLAGIPEGAVKPALSIYANIHSRNGAGECTDDACDYDNGKWPRGVLVQKDFLPVRWVKHPVLKEKDKCWEALLREDSAEAYIFLPPEGFAVPTVDGLYRPDTGTPFATEKDKDKAIRILNRAGLDGKKEASYFWRIGENKGVYSVTRQNIGYDGPFVVFASIKPGFRDDYIGSRPINRSKQIAEPATPLMVSEEELDVLMTAQEALGRVLRKLRVRG